MPPPRLGAVIVCAVLLPVLAAAQCSYYSTPITNGYVRILPHSPISSYALPSRAGTRRGAARAGALLHQDCRSLPPLCRCGNINTIPTGLSAAVTFAINSVRPRLALSRRPAH